MRSALELGDFISWDKGQNYPFSACMAKLIECLGGDTALFDYDFFAGLCGDNFVFAYGNNRAFNDCVSVCEDTTSFCARVFGRIGLDYRILRHTDDRDALLATIRSFIDRGIPVLVKSKNEKDELGSNYNLVSGYDDDRLTEVVGDPQYSHSYKLGYLPAEYIFIESLPRIADLAAVYRESVEQIPALSRATAENGVSFGSAGLLRWAEDIENGRYNGCTAANFEPWGDWNIYICNIATNAGHGRGFLAKAYALNLELRGEAQLLSLLDRNRDAWDRFETIGMGFDISPKKFADTEKCAEAIRIIRDLARAYKEIENLF